ncbi:hypothetical protein NDU88_004035 [Pleurodeles waltl]|uniref:Uncharacterized protein n=1 Tax=Pleurodeles waltl TaxID=8319 RepID=A0AAV7QAQ0_PLEWA|nr:hypothetical protein NDU88_004035 [Pleurodeles waltl]
MSMRLQEFLYEIEYVPGKSNVVADFLSLMPTGMLEWDAKEGEELQVALIHDEGALTIKEETWKERNAVSGAGLVCSGDSLEIGENASRNDGMEYDEEDSSATAVGEEGGNEEQLVLSPNVEQLVLEDVDNIPDNVPEGKDVLCYVVVARR